MFLGHQFYDEEQTAILLIFGMPRRTVQHGQGRDENLSPAVSSKLSEAAGAV
jgi:hypothetical protein